MAVFRVSYAQRDGGEFFLDVEWNGTVPTSDDDVPLTGSLIGWRVKNTTAIPYEVGLHRTSGAIWGSVRTVPAGTQLLTIGPQGPVRNVEDTGRVWTREA